MSKEWYLVSPTKYASGFESDAFSADSQGAFASILSSFAGKSITLYGTKIDNGVSARGIFQNVTSDSANTSHIRQILLSKGTTQGRQYVKDNESGEYWLINSLPSTNGIYDKVVAMYCKYWLNFLSPITGEVVSYPVYEESNNSYAAGEDSGSILTVENAHRILHIPCNEETLAVDSGENGFRFLIDRNTTKPTAYRLVEVNSTGYKYGNGGTLKWTLKTDQFSPERDNPHLMIADYYNPTDAFTCSITNATSPLLLQPEDTFQLEVSASKNGTPVEQMSVSFTSSNSSVATVNANGLVEAVGMGSCVITARYEKALAQIVVNVDEVSQAAEILIIKPDQTDTILYGTSKTFEVKVFENGEPFDAVYTAATSGIGGITATVMGGGVVVTVPNDEALVGRQFILTVTCTELTVSATLNLTVRGWFN